MSEHERQRFARRRSRKRTVVLAVAIWLAIARGAPVSAGVCLPPGAFTEGRIGGQWIGIIRNFKGGYGDPHEATVYTTAWTKSGVILTTLGAVKAVGNRAAALHVLFFRDKLYVINESYGRGSMNARDEEFAYAIQRFGIRNGRLIPETEGFATPSLFGYRLVAPGTDAGDCDTGRLDASLKKAIEAGALDGIWGPITTSTR